MLEFSELVRIRGELKDSIFDHIPSVLYFENTQESSFFKTKRDADEATGVGDGKLHGITTTFTCVESLYDAGQEGRDHALRLLKQFTPRALSAPKEWQSEGAAKVYCRVRALAPLLRLHPDLTADDLTVVGKLLNEAWRKVSIGRGTEAVFEVDRGPEGRENRYPPNAYLTYWGMAALDRLKESVSGAAVKRQLSEAWLEKSLAAQIALHYQRSALADPQQLAWSICGVVRFRTEVILERTPPTNELVTAGLRAFFEQQRDGVWARGDPLFHYPEAGNAYCYVFETLSELVHLGVNDSPEATEFRRLLEPYAKNLVDSYRYLDRASRPLQGDNLYGWCSGHHPHRTSPESWATACVFRFLQGVRRLFGIWTRDQAATLLGARQAKGGPAIFRREGETWDVGYGAVGAQLSTLFVNPVLAERQDGDEYDPDSSVIARDGARSAILFGPPGTGKTKLAEAVAGAVGWEFVEVTPALFLEKGVELVSARADEVFRQLMELDGCVVLFDEIDELIRKRGDKADSLERFFTTTMLPRLTKLWDQGKVLFFLNTNSIVDVDPAIRRSHRFDAAIFVLPPSFESKVKVLSDQGVRLLLGKDRVYDLLDGNTGDIGEDLFDLAWFGLIRWDQLTRLASRVKDSAVDPNGVSDKELAVALREFGSELMSADWLAPDKNASEMTRDLVLAEFRTMKTDLQRLDPGRHRVLKAEVDGEAPDGVRVKLEAGSSCYWYVDVADRNLQQWTHEKGWVLYPDGHLRRE